MRTGPRMVTAANHRRDRARATREAILVAAERLFAERGLWLVSHRQISEAVGQRNVTAVSYHFGSRTELVRTIMARHGAHTEVLRAQHLAAHDPGDDIRDWVDCLVRPTLRHLAALGVPSWAARLSAQVRTDPTLSALVSEEATTRPNLARVLDELGNRLAHLPRAVREERGAMAHHLIVHVCADRERALAQGALRLPHESWEQTAHGLTDALLGLLTAPVTTQAGTTPTLPTPREEPPDRADQR